METVLQNAMAFLPQSCPGFTSSYPSCCQNGPHSIFFIDIFHPLRVLYDVPPFKLWWYHPCHTDIKPRTSTSLYLSVVLGFEPLHKVSRLLKSPFINSLLNYLFPLSDMLIRYPFFRSVPCLSVFLSLTSLSGLVRPPLISCLTSTLYQFNWFLIILLLFSSLENRSLEENDLLV